MTNNTEREKVGTEVQKLITSRLGWTYATECAANDISHYILADRKACLERVKKLFEQPSDRIIFPITKTEWEHYKEECLSEIERMTND